MKRRALRRTLDGVAGKKRAAPKKAKGRSSSPPAPPESSPVSFLAGVRPAAPAPEVRQVSPVTGLPKARDAMEHWQNTYADASRALLALSSAFDAVSWGMYESPLNRPKLEAWWVARYALLVHDDPAAAPAMTKAIRDAYQRLAGPQIERAIQAIEYEAMQIQHRPDQDHRDRVAAFVASLAAANLISPAHRDEADRTALDLLMRWTSGAVSPGRLTGVGILARLTGRSVKAMSESLRRRRSQEPK